MAEGIDAVDRFPKFVFEFLAPLHVPGGGDEALEGEGLEVAGGTRQTGPFSPLTLTRDVKWGCGGMRRFRALGWGWIRLANGRGSFRKLLKRLGWWCRKVSNGGMESRLIVKNSSWCERHILILKSVTFGMMVLELCRGVGYRAQRKRGIMFRVEIWP